MQPEIARWTADIHQVTRDFQSEFGELSHDQLNRKPNPKSWSVAQIIDHIITVNETYFPVLEAVRTGNYRLPFSARLGFLNRFWGRLILRSVQPDQQRKTKTMSLWEPEASRIDADILDRFAAHQERLIRLMEASADLLEKGTVISSPANRFLTYPLETAFDIIVAHEKRHLRQARETAARIAG